MNPIESPRERQRFFIPRPPNMANASAMEFRYFRISRVNKEPDCPRCTSGASLLNCVSFPISGVERIDFKDIPPQPKRPKINHSVANAQLGDAYIKVSGRYKGIHSVVGPRLSRQTSQTRGENEIIEAEQRKGTLRS